MTVHPRKSVTQADIARDLGVSQTIVSLVLRGEAGKCTPELRDRIQVAARSAGYRISRPRRKTRTDLIGLLVGPGLVRSRDECYLSLIAGIQKEAEKQGALIVQHLVEGPDDLPDNVFSSVVGCLCLNDLSDADYRRLSGKGPLVLVQRYPLDATCDTVGPDCTGGVRLVVNRLYELGHRRFGFFGLRRWTARHAERLGALYTAVSLLDAPLPRPEWIGIPERPDRTLEGVDRCAKAYLEQIAAMPPADRPTAILSDNDVHASGVMRMADAVGLRIPEDVSVVGFENRTSPVDTDPRLTTTDWRPGVVGAQAVRMLFAREIDPDLPVRQMRLPVYLIERESIGPAPVEAFGA